MKPATPWMLERCAADETTRLRLQLDPFYHSIDSADGIHVVSGGKKLHLLSSNEYLGLSRHPRVLEASRTALERWGASPCGSRLANGSRAYHAELEEALAAFLGKDACHVFSAGYLACMAPVACLPKKGDAVILDRHVHACVWDGARVSAGSVERFAHGDSASLRRLLEDLPPEQAKMIVVDGVYSMEGHIADLPGITAAAEAHRALVVVDDAHGFGVLGRGGRGTCDHTGTTDRTGIITGSFSKSLASVGGFLAADRSTIDYLRTHCRQIIFSAALPPAAASAALAALRVLQEEPEHLARLHANATHLRGRLRALGFDTWDSTTPALPVVIGDTMKCHEVWRHLWEEGFFTVYSVSPGVPPGKDLLRCAVSALHTTEILDRFCDALVRAFGKAGVPRSAPAST